MIAVIHAHGADDKLNKTVSELLALEGFSVIVVSDGSMTPISDERAIVLADPDNAGVGTALKRAFGYIKDRGLYGADEGIVIIEADGRYSARDVKLVSGKWSENRDALVIGGVRTTDVPPLKRFGEGLTRTVFAVSTGVRVHDIHTGLRAFSVGRIDVMLGIGGKGKEYLLNQLLHMTKIHAPVIEVGLYEVRFDRADPHRTTFSDAWRVYKTVFSFVGSGIISWVVDYTLLLGLHALFKHHVERTGEMFLIPDLDPKLPAVVIARIVSSTVNYFLNRRVVFQSGNKLSFILYVITVAVLLALNYLLLDLMTRAGIPLWLAQIMAQIIIYPMSFFLQRKFVFRNKKA
ncbi:MAG: GtrA family protein [Clostridia bacterium]|nr:GtrA family protein [Clostridia bacterium]